MRHRRKIGYHWIARNVLAKDDRQRAFLIGKGIRPDHFMQHHRFAVRIGQLDPHHRASGDNTDAGGKCGHIACNILGQLDHAAGFNPGCWLQFIHRDHWPGANRGNLAIDFEIIKHGFKQPRISLQRRLVEFWHRSSRGRIEQVNRWQGIASEEIALACAG